MRLWICTFILAGLSSGCTTTALERYTLNQTATVRDLRYREVLNNLASLAAAPGALPSFAPVVDGIAYVGDTAQLDAKTTWTHLLRGFSSQSLTPMLARNSQPQWTVDPVVDPDKLRALQCAILWALYGPPEPSSECAARLKKFQVDADLARLPACWLHVGRCKDVPRNACYKAHCHGTYVWITPDGMKGLSDFTLVLLDIATVDLSAPLDQPQPQATVEIDLYAKAKDTDDKTSTQDKVAACQSLNPDGSPGPIRVRVPYENAVVEIEKGKALPAGVGVRAWSPQPELRSTSQYELRSIISTGRWKQ